MPRPQQAGILCNDPQFKRFAAIRSGFPDDTFNNGAASEYLRTACNIESRKLLNSNAAAQIQFDRLRTDFDAWAGKITTPRQGAST